MPNNETLDDNASSVDDDQIDIDDPPIEEDEDGEDLFGDEFLADYRDMPELDRYDPDLLGDEDLENQGMTHAQRLRAEMELDTRDRRNTRHVDGGLESIETDREDRRSQRLFQRDTIAVDSASATNSNLLSPADVDLTREQVEDITQISLAEHPKLHMKIFQNLICFFTYFAPGVTEGNFDNSNPPKETTVKYLKLVDIAASKNLYSINILFHHDLTEWSPRLSHWLFEAPLKILPIFNEALADLVKSRYKIYSNHKAITINARLIDFPFTEQLRSLRTEHVNKFISVSGVATRRSIISPKLSLLYIDCLSCGFLIGPVEASNNTQGGSEFKMPKISRCPNCDHRGPFTLNREETTFGAYQRITLQEKPSEVPPGSIPRTKEVILVDDLVDKIRPGDHTILNGIMIAVYDEATNLRNAFPVFKTTIIANSIEQNKTNDDFIDLTDKELFDLVKSHNASSPGGFRQVVINSIAPSMHGHESVKEAIALSLFGGVERVVTKHRVRGDINCLILGDPGLGKSQFLKYVTSVFDRSIYTTGKGASGVGLTASVRRDHLTGEWVLEGGAMVLADRGVCAIDEFDKMTEQDRTSIHEAMEQQTISISKAGIVSTLSAKCAVIAAANPIGGVYDSQLSFKENVNLTEPILSRFDILCVVRDIADVVADDNMAKFVCNSHRNSAKKEMNSTNLILLEPNVLKQVINYARTNLKPSIDEKVTEKVNSFYTAIRACSKQTNGITMTVRHLESIYRVCVANARISLRNYVTTNDVDSAIRTVLNSFISTQKHFIGDVLRRKFEKRYLANLRGSNDLIDFCLSKMFKTRKNLDVLLSNEPSAPISSFIEEKAFRFDCLSHVSEANDNLITKYLTSEAFSVKYYLEGGKIYER